MTLRIGTRGSALALAQSGWVAERLPGDAQLVTLRTSGDRGEGPSDKSRWVDTIERALLDGEVDLAVHSAKDVPGDLAPGTEIVAVPPREDPGDLLLGDVPDGARVGTASLRRRAQRRAWRRRSSFVASCGTCSPPPSLPTKTSSASGRAPASASGGIRRS